MAGAAGAGHGTTAGDLPLGLTSFVGRQTELARTGELLAQHRLVTVAGPGGSGKTRVAIEAARRIAPRFEDGVWLLELAQLEDPDQIPSAVAAVLDVRAQPDMSIVESLAAILGGRHLLLLLDNCEHLGGAVADLCDRLLRAAPDLRVLATSREPLGVAGETCYRLPPLPVPGPNDDLTAIVESDAIELFLARAAQADPDFSLTPESAQSVASVVRRLDGMPLAIELAAAQLDVLDLSQLVAGLDDRFRLLVSATRGVEARQASLAATVDWSARLLEPGEQRVFRRLSIFPGPFTADAAEAAAGPDVAATLSRLVRRSLVVAPRPGSDGQSRYSMLETLRAYAAALLVESGEGPEAAAAAARWTVAQAERAAACFDQPDDAFTGLWGDNERDNLHDIMAWVATHDPDLALRLAVALGPWWLIRGHLVEGRSYLERALAAAPQAAAQQRAAATLWLTLLAHESGDFEAVVELSARAVALLADDRLSRLLVDCVNASTLALLNLGQPEVAAAQSRHALEVARTIRYPAGEAYACACLAYMGLAKGDFRAALSWAEAANAVAPDGVRGHTLRRAATALADASAMTGDLDRARRLFEATLEQCQRAGDRSQAATQLDGLARIALRSGRRREAGELLYEAIRISAEVGERLRLADCLSIAAVWAQPDRPEDAAVIWGAARSLFPLGIARPALMDIVDQADPDSLYDSVLLTEPMLAARRTLGPERARAADERGARMSFDVAVAFALQMLSEGPVAPDARGPGAKLSKRERELIDLLAEGLTDREIGEKLYISIRTVRTHLDRIREKTGARRRAELARLATPHSG